MSDTEHSTATEDGAGGAPKRSFKKIIIILVVLGLLGGGGYYYWRTKSAAAEEQAETSEDENSTTEKKSKSKKSSDDAEEASEDEEKPAKKSASKSALQNDKDVKNVVEVPPFIINLADSENARYLRMTVSLGIGGEEGGESEKPDQIFLTRVRNAMLAVLVEKKSDEILTVEGKAKLRKELLKAAREASEEPEVKAIYITDFIVQL